MAIIEATVRPVVDLTVQGNSLALVSMALKLSKTLELNGAAIIKEMTSSNYAHLINVFEHYFGEYVDIMLPKQLSVEDLKKNREQEKKKVLQRNVTPELMESAYLR